MNRLARASKYVFNMNPSNKALLNKSAAQFSITNQDEGDNLKS